MAGQNCPVTGGTGGIGFHNDLCPQPSLIASLFAKSPEEGVETPIYLASSPAVAAVSGKYFVDCEPVASSPASYDEQAARRLWDISGRMTCVSC